MFGMFVLMRRVKGGGPSISAVLICFYLLQSLQLEPVRAFSAIYHDSPSQGRKFGGYRIVPKACKDMTNLGKSTGICMFNYECSKKNGTVVGSCMDGFLFGACCRLPPGSNYIAAPDEYHSTTQTLSSVTQQSLLSSTKVAIHGTADTVLLHENGTEVNELYRPEDFEFNSRPDLFLATERPTPPETTRSPQKSTTWHFLPSYSTTQGWKGPSSWSEDNMVQVATIPVGQTTAAQEEVSNEESINHILTLLNDTNPVPEPERHVHPTTSSPTLSTWVSVDTRPQQPTYYSSTTSSYYRPPYSTTAKPSHHSHHTTLKPSYTYHATSKPSYSSTKPPYKKPAYTTAHHHHTKLPAVTPNSSYHYSWPPSSTLQYVQGPSFQVTPEVTPTTITAEPAPTVIVLGPVSSGTKKPKPSQPTIIVNTEGNLMAYKPNTAASAAAKPDHNGLVYDHTFQSTKRPTTAKPKPTVISTSTTHHHSPPPVYTSLADTQVSWGAPTVPPTKYDPVVQVEHAQPTQVVTQLGSVPSSTELLVAFPPVRDPNANLTAQERPEVVSWATQQTTVPAEQTTPPLLVEDEKLDNKVHKFVEKIVQSLQGNFVDLENVLLDGQSTQNATVNQLPNKKPTTTKKPQRRPSKKPSTTPSTARPRPLITRPPPRPTTLTSVTFTSTTTTTTTSTTTRKPPRRTYPTTTTTTKKPVPTIVYRPEVHSTTEQSPVSVTEVDYKRECGVRPLVKNGRIVGGKGASFGEWPWQVLVREATWLGLFTKNKCGGVLITNRYVITAAHCQPGFLASLLAVFGEYDISGELESKRSVSKAVRRVIVHRYYDAATFENDIALLELESPVTFDQHIVPICMPKDDDDFTGRMATVTGWGRLKYGGGVPSVLQEVQVPVIENNVCQEMFHTAGHSKTILNSFICAGYAHGQRDSCEGDSGGPLMLEREDGHWVLAGTVSHGIKCAAPYLPGVYMRTTYYKPWLQTITSVKDL